MSALPGTTFTFCNWLLDPAADSALGAADLATGLEAGAAAVATGFGGARTIGFCWPGIAAGFTVGTGAPAAGLEAAFAGTPAAFKAASVSLACFCCSDFATLRALSMASGFCAAALLVQAAPSVI